MKKILIFLFLVGSALALCGDGVCDLNETCRNCPEDCSCVLCGPVPASLIVEISNPDIRIVEDVPNDYAIIEIDLNVTRMGEGYFPFLIRVEQEGTFSRSVIDMDVSNLSCRGRSSTTSGRFSQEIQNCTAGKSNSKITINAPKEFGFEQLNITVGTSKNGFEKILEDESVSCVVDIYGPSCNCDFDGDCDDGNECTVGFCDDCICTHIPVDCGVPCSDGFCDGEKCVTPRQRLQSCECEICDEGLFCYEGICRWIPECGNDRCEIGECELCPQDCTIRDCQGNGVCNIGVGQNCENSPNDCVCRRGEFCEPDHPSSDSKGCLEPFCGDGVCREGENCMNCPEDCPCPAGQECVDGVCRVVLECTTDRHCDDGQPCTENLCIDNECQHREIVGCELEDRCYPIGTRQIVRGSGAYCGYDENWWATKDDGSKCDMDFECKSRECKYGKCGPITLFDIVRIVRFWIRELRNIVP